MERKHQVFLIFCLIILGIDKGGNAANILFFGILGSLSHHIAIHPLAVRLAQNGHNITYLSSVNLGSMEDSKVTYFYPKPVTQVMDGILSSVGDPALRNTDSPNTFTIAYQLTLHLCQVLYDTPEVQHWISKVTFDLLIVDACYSECALGLAHKFKIPHIVVNPATFYPWQYDLYGLPAESSWIPDMRLNYPQEMDFFQRVYNVLHGLEMYFSYMSNDYYPKLNGILRQGLQDPEMPSVDQLQRNASLVLLNSYFPVEYARSLPPFVIPVGGLHIGATVNETLPKELESFIAKFGNNGFVFISFGTVFKLSDTSLSQLVHIMTTKFSEIGFIFKWNGELPTLNAPNVKFVPWVPQQVILAHPAIRAFVSHCGMLSANEAVHYGVPVLAIPGFVDQDFNAASLVRLGVANRLELTELNEENMEAGLMEIIFEKRYKDNVKMLSQIYRDRPQHPLDAAVWWTEYVLRHETKGSDLSLLKPLGMNQFWFQRRLIDVYGFFFLMAALALFVLLKLVFVLKRVWNWFRNLNKNDSKKRQ